MSKRPITKGKAPTLREFARSQRRAELRAQCPVCALPQDLLEEIRVERRQSKVSREVVIAYVRTRGHRNITSEAWDRHLRGQHDSAA